LTVGEYFDHVRRLVAANSLVFEPGFEMVELRGSNGRDGRIRGRLGFTERTFLQVMERIQIRDGAPVRLEYAYYLILDGQEIWAHDNDPSKPMPLHQHDRDHNRLPDHERTLQEVIAKAWETASDEDFWAGPKQQQRRQPPTRPQA
jgi:hypothetical protein